MQKGRLYRTTKGVILYRIDDKADRSEIPEIDIKIETTTVTLNQRKLRARWGCEMAQDLQAYYGTVTNSSQPVQTANWCEVPKDWIVMYVETGKTGSYKLVCGDFIGWTSETLNLLEEIRDDAEGQALSSQ